MFNLFAANFAKGSWDTIPYLYPGIALPTTINYNFLNLIDLSKVNYYLAVIVVIAQFYQMGMVSGVNIFKKPKSAEEKMMRNMNIFFVATFVIILIRLPSALSLYFLSSVLISLLIQVSILKKNK